jgi:hypothetical protein
MTCCGWVGFPGLQGFSFHECTCTDVLLTTIATTFSYVLICSDIIHRSHHRGASRKHVGSSQRMKWPKV